jgi:broad specificity phosphatase PhoE
LLFVVFGVIGGLSAALFGAALLDAWRGITHRRSGATEVVVDVRVEPRHLVLVRHGQTQWSESGQHTSRTDVALTELGRAQAGALREQLDVWVFDRVFVSPMTRAKETLELLYRDEPVRVLEDLREWDYGQDEGRTTADIRKERPDWTVWDGPLGGETVYQVAARARRVIHEADGDVLVVGHGHQLRVLAACWLGLDPYDGRLLSLDPATVSVLGHEREQRVIACWNVSAPAPADGER